MYIRINFFPLIKGELSGSMCNIMLIVSQRGSRHSEGWGKCEVFDSSNAEDAVCVKKRNMADSCSL